MAKAASSKQARKIGVLISGRGSNLQAILTAIKSGRLDATVAIVLSNRAEAGGLVRARDAGVEARFMDPRDYVDRESYDLAVVALLEACGVELICLAGYMRLVGAAFLAAFPNRILNIHPSLLPAFPGVHAQRQALEHGVRVTGATAHLVTQELDNGPIILQAAVPVLPGDDVETLSARILKEEHRIYPEAIQLVLHGGWSLKGRRFVQPTLILPADQALHSWLVPGRPIVSEVAGSGPRLPAGS